jgi:phage tail sheath protein FI
MTTDFLHGVEVIDVDDSPRAIRTLRSSVVGIIGTAPDASEELWPMNRLRLVTSRRELIQLGTTGTLPWALDMLYDNAARGAVVVRGPARDQLDPRADDRRRAAAGGPGG